MVSLKWCCGQSRGVELVESNDNLVDGYLKMAEDAIGTMGREKKFNRMFAISACYYSMYYSLYAVFMKVGVKCEIHACSLELMKFALMDFYSEEELKLIRKAFDLRNLTQYYVNKFIEEADVEYIFSGALGFLSKSINILAKLNEDDIKKIRGKINGGLK